MRLWKTLGSRQNFLGAVGIFPRAFGKLWELLEFPGNWHKTLHSAPKRRTLSRFRGTGCRPYRYGSIFSIVQLSPLMPMLAPTALPRSSWASSDS